MLASNRFAARWVVIVIMAAAAWAYAEDETGETKAATPSTLFTVEKDGAVITFGDNLPVPEAVRDEVPLHKDLNVQVVDHHSAENRVGLYCQTSAKAEDVAAFYKKTLEDAGWTAGHTSDNPAQRTLEFQKEKRLIVVMIMPYKDTLDVVIEVRNVPAE